MKFEEAMKLLNEGKKISEYSCDVTTYLIKESDGRIHEYNFGGNLETLSPSLYEQKKDSNAWYVVSEKFIKNFRKALDYLKQHGWYQNTDTLLLKSYKLGFISNYISAAIDLINLDCSLTLINIERYNAMYDIFPIDKIEDEDSVYDVKLSFNETKKDFEFVRDLLYSDETRRVEKQDEDMCGDAEDKDIGCTNHCCGDCAEATYSSREYYELKKEIVEKDHEIWKLKRTIEALEYLIYNCIPKDDRRKY